MLCNQDCYDMMLLWDSLLLRSKGFSNTACLSALILTASRSVHAYLCVYECMCLPGLLMPRTAAGILINGINNYENWKERNVWLLQRHKRTDGTRECERENLTDRNAFTHERANERSTLAGMEERTVVMNVAWGPLLLNNRRQTTLYYSLAN